jgi:UPF0042 nucleotide-binding protein
MRVVVVTGMSGSGKSVALRALEDAGYYAIDNLPVALFDTLVNRSTLGNGEVDRLALVVDTRDAQNLSRLPPQLDAARAEGHEVEVVFLDASDAALSRRFSETRRRHPLVVSSSGVRIADSDSSKDGLTVAEAIEAERALLEPLRSVATRVIDTSTLTIHQLKRELSLLATVRGARVPLGLTVLSFGFRHGVPQEADLVFDVRFLPNPYFVEHLRPLTGLDEACAAYVLENPMTKAFLDKLFPMLEFLVPQYENEGKAYLTIAIGCTGGQHRSVAIAARLAEWLRAAGRDARLRHREIREPRPRGTSEVGRGGGGPSAP